MVVSVDEDGVISDIDHCPNPDRLRGVEHYNGVLIPAMVNAHCHLELSYMRGRIAPGGVSGGGLVAFVQGIERVRADVAAVAAAGEAAAGIISQTDISGAISYWDARMAADGIGLVGDICNDNVTFNTKMQSPIRYHSFVELFGFGRGAEERARALLEQAATTGAARRLAASTTPHSTYSVSDARFAAAVRRLSDGGPEVATASDGETNLPPLSIHFMEDPAEAELFRRRGALWEWYCSYGLDRRAEFDLLHWGSPVERIIGQVPSGRRIMLVHNTFIGQDELDALQKHFGDNLTLVLCPRSNLYITGQLPPVEMPRRSGVRIAVGTDSLASNTSLSMVDELKLLARVDSGSENGARSAGAGAKAGTGSGVPLEELLRWATADGAEALGCETQYGAIEVGRPARLTLLEGVDFATLTMRPGATTRKLI